SPPSAGGCAARWCWPASTTGWAAGACRWMPCRVCWGPAAHESALPLRRPVPREAGMKVMLGVSGGVDSSVAALLLRRAGHEVEGLFMQNWEEDDRGGPCRADEDRKDAVAVCAKLGLPFHARNFAAQYWDGVFEHFLAEYRA